nr:MAG TPA: hypothetical protein [Caudoviricetes sp.]
MNVRFFFTDDRKKYDSLVKKDPLALYFIEDAETGYCALYKGDSLIAVGNDASSMASGLMSTIDKQNLDNLVKNGVTQLTSVDGTIVITDEDGKKNIAVAISTKEGNALTKVDGGLFVPSVQEVSVPEYTIEKQEVSDEGFIATYKLKKTENGESTYVGDAVNVPKDKVLQSAVLKIVEVADEPYENAKVGDKYIDMAFNDETQSHIYVPLGDIGGDVSAEIKIDSANANGLSYVDGTGLSLALASADSNGAMSKEMFASVKGLLDLDIADNYSTKEDVKATISETVGTPNAEQFTIDNNGVLNLNDIDADKVIYNGEKLSSVLDNATAAYTWVELPEIVNADVSNAASTIASASNGAVVKMSAGTVSEAVAVDKSVTVEGENAGVAQNFSQEV